MFAAFLATSAGAAEPANLAGNGGFEDGVSGWLYQQWEGKQPPGEIDAQDFKEGKASFRMGVAGESGGRYFAKEIKIEDPSKDHVVLVWLKTKDVPHGAARLQIGIEGRGWLGSATGQTDALVLGGTTDWKQYGVFLSAGALGEAKKITLFFKHDQLGKGTLWIDDLVVRPGKESDVPAAPKPLSLSGDTSRPDTSTFVLGEKVQLTFQVAGLEEGQKLTLPVRIVDEHEKEIATASLPVVGDAKGHWTGTMDAPGKKLGFYRVRAELSNGARIESLGSRAAGYLTYAVVPDPAGRKLYSEKETFFGMQGGYGPWAEDICRKLGIRWVLDDSLQWKRQEPNKAGEFDADKEIAKLAPTRYDGSKWVTYPLPTLFGAPEWAVDPATFAYMTGALTEEGEKAWDAYCRKAARVFSHRYPDLEQHIYQITWEPIRPWGYRGTDKQLARIYEIAHKALHEVDPKAVVAGPCRGIKEDDVPSMRELAQAGIMPYLDAFTAHPYYPMPSEKEGMVACLRNMKRTLRELSGKDLAMYGTEQGHSTDEDPSRELNLARELMRQNLMMLGEGFRFNILFYIVDYRLGSQRGYGYYYTLLPGVPWAPGKIGPKPIAPALAAQSLLLEGHKSTGAIEWLGETAWGYAFQRGDDVVLALWDYGEKPRKVMIPVGAESVAVYDWMGNAKATPAPGGVVPLELGPEPVYVAGVSSALWGDGAKALRLAEGSFVSCPAQRVTIKAVVSRPKDGPDKAELRFEADPRLGVKPQTREITFGGAEQLCEFEVDVPATTEPGRYTFHMLLRDGGRDLGVAGGAVETVSPVQILDILPAEVGGQARGLALLLKDRRGSGISGTVAVELEGVAGAKASSEFRLEASKTSRVVVDLGKLDLSPARIVDVATTIKTSDGYVATEKARELPPGDAPQDRAHRGRRPGRLGGRPVLRTAGQGDGQPQP